MRLILQSLLFAAVMPPPLPVTPQRIVVASVPTTNNVLKMEWPVPNQIAVYQSTNLSDWTKVLTLASEVVSNITIEVESEPGPSTFYKWEMLK